MLSQTVALVTGGRSGLGAATAKKLLQCGARVCIADLGLSNGSNNDGFIQWLTVGSRNVTIFDSLTSPSPAGTRFPKGPAITLSATDVTNTEQILTTLNQIEQFYGQPPNAVINCAGIATAKRTISKKGSHPLEDFRKTIEINLIGTFNVNRLAAERMIQNTTTHQSDDNVDNVRGCIINTASIAAYEGQIGQVAYAASKAGIIGMTLPMARDLASYNIRVMTIAPGLFETPLLEGLPDEVKQQLGSTVPYPSRLGKPEEFASLVVSILQNNMLNGSVIRLDGALRMPP